MKDLTNLTDEEINIELVFAHHIFSSKSTHLKDPIKYWYVDSLEASAARDSLAKTLEMQTKLKAKYAKRPAKSPEGVANRQAKLDAMDKEMVELQKAIDDGQVWTTGSAEADKILMGEMVGFRTMGNYGNAVTDTQGMWLTHYDDATWQFRAVDAGDVMNPIRFKYLNLWTYTRAIKRR